MQTHSSTRRIGMALAMAGFAVTTIGCGDVASSTTPTAVASSGGADASVQSEIAAVRQATARFHNLSVANDAGYSLAGEPCVASPFGTMGFHAVNPGLTTDQQVNATEPEVLLYISSGQGYRLTGVEYIKTVLLRDPSGNVAPWFASTPWPSNYVVVSSTPQLFGQAFQGPMPGHNSSMPWHWDLHAWIWTDNPNGMFAQWNPSLSCQ